MKKEFNVVKARKNLLVFDYITLGMTTIALMVSIICMGITRIPYVLFIFKGVITLSLILFFISIKNIVAYYKNSDELFKFI